MSGGLVTVAHFLHVHEAHLARAALEAEGIRAFVADENIVNINHLYSTAIGGVRLQVAEADRPVARQLLRAIAKGSRRIEISPGKERPTAPHCPLCGSREVNLDRRPGPLSVLTMIAFLFPLPWLRRRWRCSACGHMWRAPVAMRSAEAASEDERGGP